MLLYPHSYAGLPLLLTLAGSAIPRAVVPAFVSALFTLVIEEAISQEFLNHIFAHPYPYTVFANLVGFTLVFRTNIAYNRYWEGISQLKQMSAKWGDAAFHVLSMDCIEKPAASPPQPGQQTLSSTRSLYRAAVCHRFSLLHALGIAHLRREIKLRDFGTAPVGAEQTMTTDGYEAFHRRSCLRSDFSSMYFTLGLVEEASEVLQACREKAADDENSVSVWLYSDL